MLHSHFYNFLISLLVPIYLLQNFIHKLNFILYMHYWKVTACVGARIICSFRWATRALGMHPWGNDRRVLQISALWWKCLTKILKEKEILLKDRNFNPSSFDSVTGSLTTRQSLTVERAERGSSQEVKGWGRNPETAIPFRDLTLRIIPYY